MLAEIGEKYAGNLELLRNVGSTNTTAVSTDANGANEVCKPVYYDNEIIAFVVVHNFVATDSANGTKSQIDSALFLLEQGIRFLYGANKQVDKHPLTVKIEQYIEEHLSEKLTINKLCEHFEVDRDKLYAVFYIDHSDKVLNYITNRRLNVAKQLLRDTTLTVKTISQQVGFSNPDYFKSVFTKKVGISPSDYRNTSKPQAV